MNFIVAVLPITALVVSVLALKRTVSQAAAVSLIVLLLASFYWDVALPAIGASALRGIFLATEIALVVFGAILIFELLERQNLLRTISRELDRRFPDKITQTIFILFGVVIFMEGVAGFGTPAIIAIPLLIGIGYKAKQSVILALLADSVPVSFGAVGLPITFGIRSVLDSEPSADTGQVLSSTLSHLTFLNSILYFSLAIILLHLAQKYLSNNQKSLKPYLPLMLIVASVVSLVSYLTAVIIGPELASILAGLSIMTGMLVLSKSKIMRPVRLNQLVSKKQISLEAENKRIINALVPYSLLVVLLLVSRLPVFGLSERLKSIDLSLVNIFGSQVSYSIAPFYSAAAILMACGLFSLAWFSKTRSESVEVLRSSLKTVAGPYLSLLLVLMFVQIFINSNSSSNESMPLVIANSLSDLFGEYWALLAPTIGALGSFLAGSATVSNLVFSGIQYDVAIDANLKPGVILALQSVGAALGNMIALHNVIAALAIARISSSEASSIIRSNAKYLAGLLMIAGVAGLILTTFS